MSLRQLEWSVLKSPKDNLYYVVCHNETGGCELSTWYGYEDKDHTVKEFQFTFNIAVYDPETKTTYETKQGMGTL